MHRVALLTALALSSFALGCSSQRLGLPGERVGEADSAIFHGTPDPGHAAVVFVDLGNASCSGTIIANCNGTGYVLTAAHCCDTPVIQAIMGDDAYDPGAIQFPASNTKADPAYAGPPDDDFCMFQISGTDNSTPVIPAMQPSEDNLKQGDMVEFVGYGITENNDNNTQRRHVSDDISYLDPRYLQYDQQPGGPCNGDSGGPSLSKVNGQERVSGVTSQGDEGCVSDGESGRVSAVYDKFIKPYLGACAPPPGGSSSSSSVSSSAASTSASGGETATSTGASTADTGSATVGVGSGTPEGATGGPTGGDGTGGGSTGGDETDRSAVTGGCACEAAGGSTEMPSIGVFGLLGLALAGLRARGSLRGRRPAQTR